MIIVDSHCHLDMLEDYDNMENIINRAKAAHVSYLQTICVKLENFNKIIAIAEKYNNVFASVGIHPSEVSKKLVKGDAIVELATHKKVIGIGETGLDYFYNKDKSQQKKQQESFIQHIIAAQKSKLPVIIHTRDAEDDTYQLISEYKKHQDFSVLIHCFTASKEFARKILDLGGYISISGIVTFKKAEELQDVVKFLPIEKLLIETDSPYLAPTPYRGKTNEPSYTKYIAQFIAQLKNISIEEVALHTTNNFFSLFSKAEFIK